MKRIAILFVVLVLGLSTLLVGKLRQQNQRRAPGGTAEIEGVRVDVASKVAARILKLHVRKGDNVKQGDLLVTLDCADPMAMVDEASARVRAARAQAQAMALSSGAAKGQAQVALAARSASLAQAASLASQRDATMRQAQRMETLANDVAFANRDQTRSSAQGLEHQVKALEAQAMANKEQAVAAGATWKASGAQTQAANETAGAAEAALRRAQLLVEECTLRAPRDGLVSETPREEGELLPAGFVAMQITSLAEARATFYLPNSDLAYAKTNGEVDLMADAYPNERWKGRILNVGAKAEFTPRNIVTRNDRDRLVFPVEIAVPNTDGRLRPGMPVEIAIVGAQRT